MALVASVKVCLYPIGMPPGGIYMKAAASGPILELITLAAVTSVRVNPDIQRFLTTVLQFGVDRFCELFQVNRIFLPGRAK